MYPETCYGIYSYHFLQNLKSRYEKSGHNITHALNALNSVVHAYTLLEYESNMQQLDVMNKKIKGW